MRSFPGSRTRDLLFESWLTARSQLRRSVLCSLSIAWGLATFVLMQAYGKSVSETVLEAFYTFGPDAITITPGRTTLQAGGQRAGRQIRFTLDDIEYLRQTAPAVGRISPEILRANLDFAAGARILRSTLVGVWPEYGTIRELPVEDGRWLHPDDEWNRARVLVLAADLKKRLFGDAPAVGQIVQVRRLHFTVVGVLRRRLQRWGDSGDNDRAFLPVSSFTSLADARYLSSIVLAPEFRQLRSSCVEQVRRSLGERHRFHPSDPLALRIWDVRRELEESVEAAMTGLKLLIVGIGLLTLAVGSIGIMNIMLVSVVARSREVGMAKSMGARNRDIFLQFLGESMLLALAGGAGGILLACLIGWMVGPMPLWSAFSYSNTGVGEVSLKISLPQLGLAWLLLAVVGVASGLWPALRAASMDPVEALRRE